MRYAPSRDRQWHMYSAIDAKTNVRRMFLRALVRQPNLKEGGNTKAVQEVRGFSLAEDSVANALQVALDELDLAAHDTNGRADHVHMYLCILRAQELGDLAQPSRYSY